MFSYATMCDLDLGGGIQLKMSRPTQLVLLVVGIRMVLLAIKEVSDFLTYIYKLSDNY